MRIELRGVSKSYGRQRVLDGVSLAVEHGERVALVGPNGSGKSTLLRAVMGLVRCDGQVKLDGKSPFEARDHVALRLAYVPQVAPQLGASVRDVVRAVSTLRGTDEGRVANVAERLDLSLGALAAKPFRALSGGMKQKLLVAMALSTEASLLILDEPTASLDDGSRRQFTDLLEESARDATTIVCSHRLDEIQRMSDRVIELGEGRVVRDLTALPDGPERSLSPRRLGGRR